MIDGGNGIAGAFVLVAAILLMVVLTGCATTDRLAHADQLARQGGLTRSTVRAGDFTLTAYSHIRDPAQPVDLYIEGDGLAWRTSTRLSSDPTPQRAMGLELASLDPAVNVVYLARPCQFADLRHTICDSAYWSNKRFSEEVVDSLDQAVDFFMRRALGRQINLIGYSGGGAVAALLAARRHDVASLRTVAGNLNHELVNRLHSVSPMPESLNPVDVVASLRGLPQIHFVGAQDRVIPRAVADSFAKRAGNDPCLSIIEVEGATHESGWQDEWRSLLRIPVHCNARAR